MVKKARFIVIMLTFLSLIIPLNTTYAEGTTIQVDPPTSTVIKGTTFTVNITITNVTDLAVWEFQLYYLNAVLNCTNVVKGPFLEKDGHTQFFTSLINNKYNATHGWILAGSTLIGQVPGVNGSGTLATITFQAKAAGDTLLDLTGTTLKDSTPPPRNPIPHTSTDGTVTVVSEAVHDVAINNVDVSKTVVGQGYSLNIIVNTENQGDFNETFEVTVYADLAPPTGDEIIIGEQAISNLTAGALRVTNYVWNTSGVTKGNYTISAYAWPVLGETDLSDNNCTDGWTLITKVGDLGGGVPPQFFKCDGKCDGKDYSLFLQCYKGTAPPGAMYLGDLGGGVPPQFFKCDGKCDGKDYSLFLQCYKGQGPQDP